MGRMPTINAKVMINFLNHLGFVQVRQKGSHKFFRHNDGRTATVLDHPSEDLGRGITSKIFKDKEDFLKWQSK